MLVRGGMGTVTARIGEAARSGGRGDRDRAPRRAHRRRGRGGARRGARRRARAPRADRGLQRGPVPHARLWRALDALPDAYNRRLDSYLRDGTTMKVNLALRGLPRFSCLVDRRRAGRRLAGRRSICCPTSAMSSPRSSAGSPTCRPGRLPEFPTIEWYIHTTLDRAMKDEQGRHNSALFVQWVPYALSGGKSLGDRGRGLREAPPVHLRPLRAGHERSRRRRDGAARRRRSRSTSASRAVTSTTSTTSSASRTACRTRRRSRASTACSAGTHPAGSVIGCAGTTPRCACCATSDGR